MKTAPSRLLLALLTCLAVVGGGVLGTAPAQAADTGNNARHSGKVVGTAPSANTPGIMDGTVDAFAEVGNLIIVGGSFTRVRNPGSATDIPRSNLFAFDAATGKVSTTFVPNPDGAVLEILPAADGTSVYLGGSFNNITVGGVATAASRLARLNVSTGAKVAGFNPGTINGQVRDLELTGNRLYVAGKFTHLQGRVQKGLGTLNATTGAYDPYFTAVFAGTHRPELSTITSVLDITIDPTNSRMVAAGNFTSVNGQTRSQIAMFDLTGTTSYALANWYTTLFQSACGSTFESYITDVNYSPDGKFFVVSTTGGFGGDYGGSTTTSGCDVVARFEANGSGLDVRPTWGNYTGGDSTWSVEVTDDVVYVGGHQRWQNNPLGGEGTSLQGAGEGAVERTGIAALSTVNGMPLQWNPTRSRGVGVKDMLATEAGLYIGSDTTVFNNVTRNRIAFTPLSTGKTLPVIKPLTLPADVFTVAATGSQLVRRGFDGTTVTGGPVDVANGPGWSTTVGAFMLNGTLYTARSDGELYKQTFNGSTYGTPTLVNTADLIVRQAAWHGEAAKLTSLFYSNGRIYYTQSGLNRLYSRAFESESDVVGQVMVSTAAPTGVSYTNMRGAFVAGGKLYYGNAAGTLSVADWNGSAPVASTAKTVTGAGSGWNTRAMFAYQGDALPPINGSANAAPTAKATGSCTDLVCSFDGSTSTDADGTISSYAWSFGDGANGTGARASHTYATAGAKTATLTVTDNAGATSTTTVTVQATEPTTTPNVAPTAKATGSCADLVCSFSGSGSTDSDGTISSYAWDFGDGTTGTGVTAQRTYTTAGSKTVTLTVTDNAGAKGSTTVTVDATEGGGTPTSPVTFVGQNNTQGNRTNHTTAIPTTVQAGDQLLLFLTGNTLTPTWSAPEGWTLIQTRSGDGTLGFAYSRTAVAGDAGKAVTIVTSGYAKSVMTVAAYRGGSVTASSSTLETADSARHVTPPVTAPDSQQWLVSYWSDKGTNTTTWTLPTGVTRRAAPLGTGTGHTSAVLGDSDGPVAAGERGGLAATTDVAGTAAVMFSVLIG